MDEKDLGDQLEKVLISEEQIQRRLSEMAGEIDTDYDGRDLLLVGVLKGAVMVMADLARTLHTPVEMDWMAVSSYGSAPSPPAWSASSRTSTRTSPAATC